MSSKEKPVQGEADEHRMMMDDLRLYGTAFSKNGKRIPPEDVYITHPPAPAVKCCGDIAVHCQQDGCQFYKHPPECWLPSGDVERHIAALRAMLADEYSFDEGSSAIFTLERAALNAAIAALRSQGQADAVVETEWIVSCGSGAAPAPRFDNEPAAFARWAEEVSIPSYIRSGRMRQASVTKVTTISEDRTAAALAQQANQEQPPNA